MDSITKSNRVLELYRTFLQGKVINKEEAAKHYGVNVRSIQRDIDTIRDFLSDEAAERGILQSIEYDAKKKGYRLEKQEVDSLSVGELLAICKILIESKALSKEKLSSLLERMLTLCVSSKERDQIEWYISNEIFNYINPAHVSPSMDYLSAIAEAIKEQRVLEITYARLKERETVKRKVLPVGILFSEYYFYMMAVIMSPDTRKNFEVPDDPYPTIYRLDRIQSLKATEEKVAVDYKDRFKEGEYKNRIQYMYGGKPQKVKFRYSGLSIEAVKDKLPVSEVVDEGRGKYIFEVDAFGKGILMWLLSQGGDVEVLEPESLRNEWLDEARKILSHL